MGYAHPHGDCNSSINGNHRAIHRLIPLLCVAPADNLARRLPELRKDEMATLAEVGALNSLEAQHRRDALWQSGRAARAVGPLLEELRESSSASPLAQMSTEERLAPTFAAWD
jgi:error-prone DNA polymerase